MERKGHSRRKVHQWHFSEWPDATRPARIEALLDFVQSIRASIKRAPMLVHCSCKRNKFSTSKRQSPGFEPNELRWFKVPNNT
uniref:Tyrosine-protein phosphatase domain-containing protein n=1 Tax=Globodera pallida TaxID=36090 RepID=A0A183CNY2_GLOPA